MTDRISFYKVPDAFVEIEDAISDSIDEETGEVTCDVATFMERDDILSRADEGIEWYAKQHRNLDAQRDAIWAQIGEVTAEMEKVMEPFKKELDLLSLALKARVNRQDFNKWLVAELLQVLGTDELVLSTGKKVWTKTTESVEVSPDLDFKTLDPKLVKTRTTYSLDKVACKKVAEEGEWSIPGIEIVKKKTIQFPR